MLKVQIEAPIQGHARYFEEVNTMLNYALTRSSLAALKLKLEHRKFRTLIFGFGSDHFWVKQKNYITDIPLEKRLLLITEK